LKGPSNRNYGEIIIVSEEVSSCKQIYEIQFRGEKLKRSLWFRSNDPFLVILRSNEDNSFSVVAKTAPVRSTQNPTWEPLVVRGRTLCNGDLDRCIKINCYDRRRNGNHKLIGTSFTTLRTLQSTPLNLLTPNKEPAGSLYVDKFYYTEEFTFMDYIRHGTQIHFAVAVDFTISNGVYTDPKSLHYLRENGGLNPYETALTSVGEIIEHYDRSLTFPAFGKI